jgi:hypothetical protein
MDPLLKKPGGIVQLDASIAEFLTEGGVESVTMDKWSPIVNKGVQRAAFSHVGGIRC